MITMKFLAGWNAYIQSKPEYIELRAFQTASHHLQKTIEKIMYLFDSKDFFYGIFQAMNHTGVSPFIATHDYCIKVLHCDRHATVEMNVSPIYHLGLGYPEDYKTKHGKKLDQDAVIGLLAKPSKGTLPPGHTSYSYGVDAGVLFKDSKVVHNKKLTLKLAEIREGLLVTLSCENQISSTTVSWSDIGIEGGMPQLQARESDTEVLPGDWVIN